jgi:hypothetical protein
MLEALLGVLLEAGGLRAGSEAAEAEALWAAVRSEAPHMQTPFDAAWWAERISGLTGITEAQHAALLALGAVEQHRAGGEPTATRR